MQPVVRLYLADLIERGVAIPQSPPSSTASGLPDTDPWVIAIDAVSEGNKKPLANLLRDTEMPQAAREYLVDLIARGIAKPRGRPRVPAYNKSPVEVFLWLARDDVRHRPRGPHGQTVEAALVEAAIRYGITENSLRKHIEGRREATNRKRKALRLRRR